MTRAFDSLDNDGPSPLDDGPIYGCRCCHVLMVAALARAATPDGKAICPLCWERRIEAGVPTGPADIARALVLLGVEND